MHVIQIVPSISEEASGPSYSVTRLCESVLDSGLCVTLATLDSGLFSFKFPLKVFPCGLGPRRLGHSSSMYYWLKEQASSGSNLIFHNHSLWMMPNVYPGWVSNKRRIPLVVSPRGTLSRWALTKGSWVKRIFWPFVQKPALRSVSCFHATSLLELEDIRGLGFRQPVAIIANGIDIPTLPAISTSDTRTLLFLGRIHPKKGLDMLLPAWRAVQDRFPEWRLQIVGPDNGGYLEVMRRSASNLGVKRLEFTGALLGRDKWLAYQSADLFVLPTHSENFGMVVAESLAAGTPAIVTKGAPWAGLLERDAGWWIDIGVEPLVACLEDALSRSSMELSSMGSRGRKWMEEEFSWAHVGRKMGETYRWILNGGETPEWVFID